MGIALTASSKVFGSKYETVGGRTEMVLENFDWGSS